jgi:hypothetical protein
MRKLISILFALGMAVGLLVMTAAPALAADTGLLSPSQNTNSGWTSPAEGYVSDNIRATSGSSGQTVTYYNFNLSIPSGAVVNGIQASVEGSTSGRQIAIDLSYNGGANYTTGSGTGVKTTDMTGSETIRSFGGASDSWNRAWTADEFSNANFRARLSTQSGGGVFS